MEKIITESGKNGIVSGKIVITLNHTTESRQVHNHSTHDEETKSFSLHKIEAFVDGKSWKVLPKLSSTDMVEIESQNVEKELKKHIKHLSNFTAKPSFVDVMKENGYV